MFAFENKNVLVLGLEPSGIAASRLAAEQGAKVISVDRRNTPELQCSAKELQAIGIVVQLGVTVAPSQPSFDLAVISPEISLRDPIVQELKRKKILLMGELELGYQQSLCLNVAVTGTN